MPVDANDLWYCRERIGPLGTSASLAVQFAPRDEKIRLTGIFALQNEWEAIVASRNAQDIAPMRLAWWLEQLEEERERSNHPVIRLLSRGRAFEYMPIARLVQALHSYLELARGLHPTLDPIARAVLRESRGVFLHWTTLNRMEEIPGAPVQHLAAASWFTQQLALFSSQVSSGEKPSEQAGVYNSSATPPLVVEIFETAEQELQIGLEAFTPFIREPSCRSIRIMSALTDLTLRTIEHSWNTGKGGGAHHPPSIPAKLWRAWKAARNEQRT
ncbi:MAG: hypothetical protein ACYCS1_03815 [Gammaproteobacteria bacterium]